VARWATLETAELDGDLVVRARRLLLDAFDGEFGDEDWEHCLGGVHLLALEGGRLVGHAAVVPRRLWLNDVPVDVGYVEGVAVDPSLQRQGIGLRLMHHVNHVIRRDYELGALATGEWEFYERTGWERWTGGTHVRTGEGTRPTPEDDDAVMLLRWGDSMGLPLSGHLVCTMRSGDVW
jgi:aminoglycoside 2'-N-acetyltransferase I